jgi:hypothetical protein
MAFLLCQRFVLWPILFRPEIFSLEALTNCYILIEIIFVLAIHTCRQVSDSDKTPVLCNVVLEGPENDKMNAYMSSACRPLSENNCGKTIIKIHLNGLKNITIILLIHFILD